MRSKEGDKAGGGKIRVSFHFSAIYLWGGGVEGYRKAVYKNITVGK